MVAVVRPGCCTVAARLLHADPALSAKLSYLPDQYIS
jgi:hypothetical protein